MARIPLTPHISLDEKELDERFVLASGPGGQNVNKVATAVQLRFDVKNSPSLPEEIRNRLMALSGRRLTKDGVLVLIANRFRSQERNRADALERLAELVGQASVAPRPRRATKPPKASKRRRLDQKSTRGRLKKLRAQPRDD